MNPIDDHHQQTTTTTSTSTCNKEDEKVSISEAAGYLLFDESWFFGNLLHSKPRMSRCYSDPYPSSSNLSEEIILPGKSMEETFSSLQKLPPAPPVSSGLITRTPSLPEESSSQSKRRIHHRNNRGKNQNQTPVIINSLSRAPSLPSSIGRKKEEFQDEEEEEEESDFSMSKLIRQASLKNPDNTLPPRHLPKGINRQRKKPELECIIPDSPYKGMMISRQNPAINRSKLTKSWSDVVFQELQGLKDLSIDFDKTEYEEKKLLQEHEKKKQSLENNSKRSVEDMKAQIRFWARAVASNVRQEC